MPDLEDDVATTLGAAVLDANVLYPIHLCDALLRCAEARLYRPRWSAEILDELGRNLRGRIGAEQAERRIRAMNDAFPRAIASESAYRHLIDAMMNHLKDRHVVALAVAIGARRILTSNLRDFPDHALLPFGVTAMSPDDFLNMLLDREPKRVRAVIERQAASYRQPPMNVSELLDQLALLAPKFAARVGRIAEEA
ncbi:MAG: PIN domain-containing protein [Thermomicrobiales bacterium]